MFLAGIITPFQLSAAILIAAALFICLIHGADFRRAVARSEYQRAIYISLSFLTIFLILSALFVAAWQGII